MLATLLSGPGPRPRALMLDKNNFEAWGDCVVPLLNSGRLEDALDSVNKSLDLASQPEARIAPLLMRPKRHIDGVNAEASVEALHDL